MECAFDKKQFEEYCQNTWFFKMSIKRSYNDYTITGEATYYKKWKDNALFE